MQRFRSALIGVLALGLGPVAIAQTSKDCDRACLSGITDAYLAAMASHDLKQAPFDSQVKFTENGQALAPGDGLWATISKPGSYKLYFNDVKAGQAGFFGTIDEGGQTGILSLRLKVKNRKITEVETIIARREMGPLLKPDDLKDKPVFSEAVPSDKRRSREELVKIVDNYLKALIEAKPYPELFAPDCQRIENGTITALNPSGDKMGKLSCGDQLETGVSAQLSRVRDPRFPLVDEERGLVHVVMFFDHTGTAEPATIRYRDGETTPLVRRRFTPSSYMCSEVFKIEDGRIKLIEVVLLTVPYRMASGWPDTKKAYE
jgi:hypothetical protein